VIAVGPAGSIDGDRPLEELAQASGGDHTLGEFGVAAGLGDLRGGLLDEADVFPSQLDGVTVDDMDRSPSTVSARAGMEARTNRPARARSFMSFGLWRVEGGLSERGGAVAAASCERVHRQPAG
jgi:hypothetical protein